MPSRKLTSLIVIVYLKHLSSQIRNYIKMRKSTWIFFSARILKNQVFQMKKKKMFGLAFST